MGIGLDKLTYIHLIMVIKNHGIYRSKDYYTSLLTSIEAKGLRVLVEEDRRINRELSKGLRFSSYQYLLTCAWFRVSLITFITLEISDIRVDNVSIIMQHVN